MTIVVNSPVAGIGFAGAGGVSLVYPTILAQSAIPFILAGGTGGAGTQFTISATGALSTLPTLPIISGNAFIYMPSGIPGLASGWYYALIQSATTAQLYTATYTSGDPKLAVPASPTAPSGITAGSYSQTTGAVDAVSITVPGGSLGPNGSFETDVHIACSNNANTKSFSPVFGSTTLAVPGLAGTNGRRDAGRILHNMNSQSVNTFANGWQAAIDGTLGYASINTAADFLVKYQLTSSVGSDFVILGRFRAEVRYGA